MGFVKPFGPEPSRVFWHEKVLPAVRAGHRAVFVARADGCIAGSVQLDWGTPPNQPHRADVTKLVVHPDFRRRGVERALMEALLALAHDLGRDLTTLDTVTGDAAPRLYAGLGFVEVGPVPGFALNAEGDGLDETTFMDRQA